MPDDSSGWQSSWWQAGGRMMLNGLVRTFIITPKQIKHNLGEGVSCGLGHKLLWVDGAYVSIWG